MAGKRRQLNVRVSEMALRTLQHECAYYECSQSQLIEAILTHYDFPRYVEEALAITPEQARKLAAIKVFNGDH